jgi:hypothetical protein
MTVVAALVDNEPLSQVVFMQDYVQLVFQDTTLTVFCSMSVGSPRDSIGWRGPGWCDAVVGLIGQSVNSVDYLPCDHLRITFSDASVLRICLLAARATSNELFRIDRLGSATIVERVAQQPKDRGLRLG